MGKILLLKIKSSRSKTFEPSPKGWKLDQILKPNAQGNDKIKIPTHVTIEARTLPQPKRSMKQAIIFSKTAITVERAAKLMNRKNNVDHIRPLGIELNMFGRVTKINPGPAPGLIP